MSDTSNFAEDIEIAVQDVPIVGIVIAAMRWGGEERFAPGDEHAGRVLEWGQARDLLDYDYDTGYGGSDCHAVTVWTAERVFVVGVYDGSTWIQGIPRNPQPHDPSMIGGE